MKWNWVTGLALLLVMTRLARSQQFPAVAEREAPQTQEPGLLSRWSFVQGRMLVNTVFPDAGGLHPTVEGPVQFSEKTPFALRLDGDSKARHRVVASHTVVPAQLPQREMTVETWAKVEKGLEWGGLVGLLQDNGNYERGWLLGFRKTQFCFALAGKQPGRMTYLNSRRRFTPGYWYHIVGTYDGREQKIFVDGELVGQSTEQQGDINYPDRGEYVIGAYKDDNELYATEGEIEQVSVWNRVLSPDEIATRFASRSTIFPDIEAIRPNVVDWPTYNRDNQRTGVSPYQVRLPLTLSWEHQLRHAPQPAWPAPAKQDFWHRKSNLSPRVVYDRANHVVAVGNQVFVGSSADDAVRCLDANTGQELWKFFAEGPVRLAPTVADDRLLFGSDDGYVYCLSTYNGYLYWKVRLGPSDRRIPGNQRIISAWPVRSGVLVEEGIAYFCAGLFPKQGVYQAAVDVKTGKILAKGPIQKSAQGYLERRSGQLYVPTGRDPAGAFVGQLTRRGKDIGQEVRQIPEDYPYAFIGAGPLRFGGGDGKVAAFAVDTGKKVWEAAVEGKAWSLAISNGRLLVSTDAGRIYAFGFRGPDAVVQTNPIDQTFAKGITKTFWAEKALKTIPISKGYGLVTSTKMIGHAIELAQRTELQLIVLADDPETATQLRNDIYNRGLSTQITVHQQSDVKTLPYTDYVFNLVLANNTEEEPIATEELRRVLRPNGGMLVWGSGLNQIEKRGPLANGGEWSHMYANPANTVCSNDQHVGSDIQLQWFGPPGPRQMLDRHLRTVAPLWKNGRMFIPGNDCLIGVDAYNGTPLWNVEIPNSRRIAAFRDCSYIVAGEESVYVASANVCLKLDAQTGRTLATFPAPNLRGPIDENPRTPEPAVADRPKEWGYLATVQELLVGSVTAPNASRRESSRAAIMEGTYWDARPVVTSEGVFALDRNTGKTRWVYRPEGAILNSTMMIADNQVMFVESHNPETLANRPGRVKPRDLFHYGAGIVALDLKTGKELWRTPRNLHAIEHNMFGCAAEGKVVIVGSRNSGEDKKRSRVFYDVHVFDSKTGEPVWFRTQNQDTEIGGDHGEQ
ncbi:MAG: PQQ-binding-like beta-propeller repeat protein, partial [Planctomycetaceae bacterium]|nr:PQQ-binding-like beta-propeller repeat protein [Planctomycetaceae bacterium]